MFLSTPKLFVSYTLQDGEIDQLFLQNLKDSFCEQCSFDTYIDLLDNTGKDHQSYVIKNVIESDFFLLILTSRTLLSRWVNLEITTAKEHLIPIIALPHTSILNMQKNHELNKLPLLAILNY